MSRGTTWRSRLGSRTARRDLGYARRRGHPTLEELIMAEQSVEVAKGIYAAFATGDVPGVLGAFAEDIEWYEADGMPYGGLHRGGDAVAQKVFGPIAEDVDNFAV